MKKVIYTAIIGDYDHLKEPRGVTDGWEYVCFSDKILKSKTWNVNVISNEYDRKSLKAREVKIKYNNYIDADLSIWVDGSILINCDLNNFIEHYHTGNFSIMKHPSRTCIYKEAFACMAINKDIPEIIRTQIEKYRNEGMPKDLGMVGSGIMVRKKDSDVISFCEKWFDEVRNGSIRDQLSFNYINWKYPIGHNLMTFNITRREMLWLSHK